jgi:hypothetical protein
LRTLIHKQRPSRNTQHMAGCHLSSFPWAQPKQSSEKGVWWWGLRRGHTRQTSAAVASFWIRRKELGKQEMCQLDVLSGKIWISSFMWGCTTLLASSNPHPWVPCGICFSTVRRNSWMSQCVCVQSVLQAGSICIESFANISMYCTVGLARACKNYPRARGD